MSRLSPVITFYDRLLEFAWRRMSEEYRVSEFSWPLPKDLNKQMQISWPTAYAWKYGEKWLEPIRRGLAAYVPLRRDPISQAEGCVAEFEVQLGGRKYRAFVDYSDYPTINSELAGKALVYFKMQYDEAGYPHSSVVPGGFITNDLDIYRYLPRLRKLQAARSPLHEVYGRFSLSFATEARTKALSVLNAQSRFSFTGSPCKIRYSRFLREVAQSKVCIDLPGNGALCFRLFDYLAVGACVVGPRPKIELPVPLVDGVQVAYCQDDFSDLVEISNYYVRNDAAREEMVSQSQAYFDKYIHYSQLSGFYLSSILSKISAEKPDPA